MIKLCELRWHAYVHKLYIAQRRMSTKITPMESKKWCQFRVCIGGEGDYELFLKSCIAAHCIKICVGMKQWIGALIILCCCCKACATLLFILLLQKSVTLPHNTTIYGPFSGATRVAGARRELLDFIVLGKIIRGIHTDHPAGCHSIRPNQCPPPPSPHIFLQAGCPSCRPTNSVNAPKVLHYQV